jgi:hypothetical protein
MRGLKETKCTGVGRGGWAPTRRSASWNPQNWEGSRDTACSEPGSPFFASKISCTLAGIEGVSSPGTLAKDMSTLAASASGASPLTGAAGCAEAWAGPAAAASTRARLAV